MLLVFLLLSTVSCCPSFTFDNNYYDFSCMAGLTIAGVDALQNQFYFSMCGSPTVCGGQPCECDGFATPQAVCLHSNKGLWYGCGGFPANPGMNTTSGDAVLVFNHGFPLHGVGRISIVTCVCVPEQVPILTDIKGAADTGTYYLTLQAAACCPIQL